jgi:hypothetical protein
MTRLATTVVQLALWSLPAWYAAAWARDRYRQWAHR